MDYGKYYYSNQCKNYYNAVAEIQIIGFCVLQKKNNEKKVSIFDATAALVDISWMYSDSNRFECNKYNQNRFFYERNYIFKFKTNEQKFLSWIQKKAIIITAKYHWQWNVRLQNFGSPWSFFSDFLKFVWLKMNPTTKESKRTRNTQLKIKPKVMIKQIFMIVIKMLWFRILCSLEADASAYAKNIFRAQRTTTNTRKDCWTELEIVFAYKLAFLVYVLHWLCHFCIVLFVWNWTVAHSYVWQKSMLSV